MPRNLGRRRFKRDRGVEEPRAVEMHRDAAGRGHGVHGLHMLQRHTAPLALLCEVSIATRAVLS